MLKKVLMVGLFHVSSKGSRDAALLPLLQPDWMLILERRVKAKVSMKLNIMYKDRWLQKYKKEKEGWFQTSSNGTVRPCSAEQLLSHVLPPLAGIKGRHITIKVEPDKY